MKAVSALFLSVAAFLAAMPLAAQTPTGFAGIRSAFVETLRARCTAFEGGRFEAPEDAAGHVADFNGDGLTDPIIEEARFSCSTSATMFSGGSGGGAIHVFVSQPDGGYGRFAFLAHGFMVVTPPGEASRPILLLPVHAGQCDVVAEPCHAAYVWSGTGRFVSVAGAVAASE